MWVCAAELRQAAFVRTHGPIEMPHRLDIRERAGASRADDSAGKGEEPHTASRTMVVRTG